MTYSKEMVQEVWEKGRVIAEQDPAVWRQDECGAWMRREHYGQEASEYGWRIENISLGGPNDVDNLRPLHCENLFIVGAGRTKCHVSADQKGVDVREHVHSTPRNRRVGR
jgi:hypothetical protein